MTHILWVAFNRWRYRRWQAQRCECWRLLPVTQRPKITRYAEDL